jgi:hypothetical protein
MASLDSYEKLKRLYGIRNRFWVRTADRLAPLLRDAHQRALLRNHAALLMALRAAERALRSGRASPQLVFYRIFTRAFQRLRRVGQITLRPGQRAVLLSKNDHVTLTVRNADGSLDARLRQRLLFFLERIAAQIPQQAPESLFSSGEWAREMLLAALPLEEPATEKEGGLRDEILESPAGQMLARSIPGFSILLKLYMERERLKGKEWITVAREILADGAKPAVKQTFKILLSQLNAGAELSAPLSYLFNISVNRILRLQRQCYRVDSARKQIEELLPHYRKYL